MQIIYQTRICDDLNVFVCICLYRDGDNSASVLACADDNAYNLRIKVRRRSGKKDLRDYT